MIELLILIILICLFTGCSITDAIGVIASFGFAILFGCMILFFILALMV